MSLADKIYKENYVKKAKDNLHLSTSNLTISTPKPRIKDSSSTHTNSRRKDEAQDAINFPVFINPPPPKVPTYKVPTYKAPIPPKAPVPPKAPTSTLSKRLNVGDALKNVKENITSELKSSHENLAAKIDIIHKQLHMLVEKSEKIANTPVQFSNTIKDVYDSKYQIIIQGLQSKCRALMEESKNKGLMPTHYGEEIRIKQELIDTLSEKIKNQETLLLEKDAEIEKLKLQLQS
jgi:hypothetical protein